MKSVGVVIVSLNAERYLRKILATVLESKSVATVLVVDSCSTDNTVKIASEMGASVVGIRRSDFNHGATREYARKRLSTDIVVFLTQDIVPEPGFVEPLIAPILGGRAAVSYARQLPHEGADFFEAFPRYFNYPEESHSRCLKDSDRYGAYTFFVSNSCAAYSNAALDHIGGFEPTLTNEDYFAVARLLTAGYTIDYVAESRVQHSHRYTLVEEFKRYFDTGYVRAENPWVNELTGAAEARGGAFFREMGSHLAQHRPFLLPYAILQTAIKWAGYRVGFISLGGPTWLKRALSGQPYYWNSRFAKRGTR